MRNILLLAQLALMMVINATKPSKEPKRKRVEYQKFVRTKLEQKRYRGLFGLTDNIALVGEEDIVLQREFRIDFVLQKVCATIPIIGIFSHFKQYNLLEFKSKNDPLTTILLIKYIGQLFWWLYAQNTEAKKDKSNEVREDEVTLNIVTVGHPRNVIKKLDELLGEDFVRHGGGHYECNVIGVELHIFVINELPIEREYYAWLIFSEGEQYERFKDKLAQEIEKDEKYQIYLELISELEKEGKEKMAYEILKRILSEMPFEQKQNVVSSALSEMLTEQTQELVSSDILRGILSEMPADMLKGILSEIPADILQDILSERANSMKDSKTN